MELIRLIQPNEGDSYKSTNQKLERNEDSNSLQASNPTLCPEEDLWVEIQIGKLTELKKDLFGCYHL